MRPSEMQTMSRTPRVLDELGSQGLIDWSRAVLDGASVRAKKGAR